MLSIAYFSLLCCPPPPVLHIYQHQCISHTHTHTNGRTDLDICIYNLKGFLTLRLALRCARWYHTKLLAVRVGCSGKFTRIDLSRSTRRSHQPRRQKDREREGGRDQHLWPAINAAVVVPTPRWLMRAILIEFENLFQAFMKRLQNYFLHGVLKML